MTASLRDELEAATRGALPSSDLVSRSRIEGRRRLVQRRRRAVVGTGAVVAAVALGATALPSWWASTQRSVEGAGGSATNSPLPGPSRTAVAPTPITGTASDWLIALERDGAYADRMRAVRVTTDGSNELANATRVQAEFRYTTEGRTTALFITAYAKSPATSDGKSAWDSLLASCAASGGPLDVTCDPIQQTSAGPVLVRHVPGRGRVDALSLRASGVVIEATSFNSDVGTATATAGPGTGEPGMAIVNLVDTAALAPEPSLAAAGGSAPLGGSTSP